MAAAKNLGTYFTFSFWKWWSSRLELATSVQKRLATEEDLRAIPKDGQKYELVDGEVRVSPAGDRHSVIALHLGSLLLTFVRQHGLGHVMGADAGFRLPSGNVRSPDVSFVAAGRFPNDAPPEDYGAIAPDLAVEVISPGDRPRYVLDKVGEYLEAGVRLVWVIDPRNARAVAYRSLTDLDEIDAAGPLEGGEVLPGFTCRLSDLL